MSIYIHNAGVMMGTESTTEAGVETAVATMLGGTQVLVTCLLPLMLKNPQGSRIVNVTSAGQYNVGLETSDLNGTKRSGEKYDGTLGTCLSSPSLGGVNQEKLIDLDIDSYRGTIYPLSIYLIDEE